MGKSKRSGDATGSEEKPFDWGIDVPAKKRKRDDEATAADADVTNAKKSKKDKKDKKDKYKKESRKEKKDKRKNLQNLPDEDAVEDEDEQATAEAQPEPEVKKEKKSKKEDKAEKTEKVNDDDQSKKDKKKKDKKAKKEAKKNEPTAEPTSTTPTDSSNANPNGIDLSPSDAQKQDRHIVFVGNLPFSATAASISAHFASLEPVAVRCMKNKDDDKPCKGFAFVEFSKVWHMRTCLDKFHHSSFDDGVSPARKINVELTAGGGGKTKQRLEKIKTKNEKLNENRAKRIENEKTAKKEGGEEKKQQPSNGGIHPSRLARLPGLGQ